MVDEDNHTPDPNQDPTEAEIDAIVDAHLVLSEDPEDPLFDLATLNAFMTDVAQKLHENPTIAKRYGFASYDHMRDYLMRNPGLARAIKQRKAVWESSDNQDIRLRRLAGLQMEMGLAEVGKVMLSPDTHPSVKLDAFKAHARVVGVDGPGPSNSRDIIAAPGAGQGRFSISIVFSGAGTSETFSTVERTQPEEPTTIEGEAA